MMVNSIIPGKKNIGPNLVEVGFGRYLPLCVFQQKLYNEIQRGTYTGGLTLEKNNEIKEI